MRVLTGLASRSSVIRPLGFMTGSGALVNTSEFFSISMISGSPTTAQNGSRPSSSKRCSGPSARSSVAIVCHRSRSV